MRKFCVGLLVAVMLLSGCGSNPAEQKVVFTTGLSHDQVFRIEKGVCTLTEAMAYLVNMQEGYEQTFGADIWNATTDSGTVEDRLKDSVLAKIAQIKAMNLLAKEMDIKLDESKEKLAADAAKEYYDSLSDADIKAMNNITVEDITKIYLEHAVADELYDYIIRDINPEIRDDEARTITVEQILIKTYQLDASGQKESFDDAAKAKARRKAEEVQSHLNEGASFEETMAEYNEADEGTISFGKGDKDEAYEEAAFSLGTEEVSDIVEAEDGYVIIKCISTFNREETEANKVKIVAERKREVFGQQYDTFVAGLSKQLNDKLWDSVSLVKDENVTTSSLMDVYQKYFK
jgi:foldase protein PrsA